MSYAPANSTPKSDLMFVPLSSITPEPRLLPAHVVTCPVRVRAGHSPANLMGPSLNVSELEDLVRLLSGSEGAEPPAFGGYPDLQRRGDGKSRPSACA